MLELKNICKDYVMQDETVNALIDVSIAFREKEFVSILGHSGCGKTTLLNIVGGLDKYTSGDLIINGTSTKNYRDKDWDIYRNHRIGFVFQSYNLIPHLNILENVELALTLSGIGKDERRRRATEVLEKVGLSDKLKNKPNQLSGGQMQRVAIARALVNNPDIILADEPTGALDSKTSVQIMEILKEVSKDKLIIMVTHNPELAEKYSSRIIRLKDGRLLDDSDPYAVEKVESEPVEAIRDEAVDTKHKVKSKKKSDRTKMSFFTALSLSFKNLLTKKARTFLVSFAGSIGIIGIALILSLSSGFQAYINKTQEDTLSNYPITISRTNSDAFSIMQSMFDVKSKDEHDDDAVYAGDTMSGIFEKAAKQMANANDLDSFKTYIESHKDDIEPYITAIQYTYDLSLGSNSGLMSSMMSGVSSASSETPLLEVKLSDGTAVKPDSSALFDMILMYSGRYLEHEFKIDTQYNADSFTLIKTDQMTDKTIPFLSQYISEDKMQQLDLEGCTSVTIDEFVNIIQGALKFPIDNYRSFDFGLFTEMIDNQKLIESQYDLLGDSRWATEADEVVLVLDDQNELDDYVLYALGLITSDEMYEHMDSLFSENKTTIKIDYNKIIGKEYKVLLNTDYFVDIDGALTDIRTLRESNSVFYNEKFNALLSDTNVGKTLKIVGIARLNNDSTSGPLSNGLNYTSKLTSELLTYYNSSRAVTEGKTSAISLTPASINFYASSFDAKDGIEKFISDYNAQVDDESKEIEYTDYIGLIMSSVGTIITAITYVLIAFVSISLIVSSIMIGIITYISVLERIKEIGVLRSIGASKRDIKRVFVSESAMIGLVSGVLGIVVTLILNIPINLIIKHFAGLAGVASLPVVGGIVLVLISVLLTFIAGLIPARIASKKDPVVALRSE